MTVGTGEGMRVSRGQFRVDWLPGTDTLRGVCLCGATTFAEDPIVLWNWLLTHRDEHKP